MSGNTLLAWGDAGSPIFPAVIREFIGGSGTHKGLNRALRLPPQTVMSDRFVEPLKKPIVNGAFDGAVSGLIRDGLGQLPSMGTGELAAILVLSSREAVAAAIGRLPFRTRTRGAILRSCGGPNFLRYYLLAATVSDLMSIPTFGAVSLFDLLVGVEIGLQTGVITVDGQPRDNSGSARQGFDQPLDTETDGRQFVGVLNRGRCQSPVHDLGTPEKSGAGTIEDEGAAVLSAALRNKGAKWLDPIGRRFGLHGGRVPTLEEAGRMIGVTRERVRQVQQMVTASLSDEPIVAPAIDQALELADVLLPCSPAVLAEALRAAGLTRLPEWTGEALTTVAVLTGRRVSLADAGGLIDSTEALAAYPRIISAARSASNASGMATLVTLRSRLQEQQPATGYTSADLRAALDTTIGFHWLSNTAFWSDHPAGRNRLVNTSLRILAVCSPQTLMDMHEGVARNFAFRAASNGRLAGLSAPEIDLLRQFYDSHPAFSLLEDDHISAAAPIALEELGDEKQALVAILRAQPYQVMDRNSLMAACEEIGMSTASVAIWTTYDEALKRFAPNVWGLRGAVVPPGVISEVQARARGNHAAHDRRKLSGTTPSGRPWAARKLTPTILYSGVLPFDWARDQLEDRTFEMIDMLTGEAVGHARFSDHFNWGYSGLLRRYAARTGDVIRIVADLDEELCYIEIGGDELLAAPFDW